MLKANTQPQLLYESLASTCIIISLLFVRASFAEDPGATDFFERRVRPVFIEHCLECHGSETQENALRLDSREAMLRGGERGPAVIVGSPDVSLLVRAIHRQGELKMPPSAPLDASAIAAIESWIATGAVWPRGRPVLGTDADHVQFDRIAELRQTHWAFQPTRRGDRSDSQLNSIDDYVERKRSEVGLSASPEATSRTLIRRLYFDLIGLPPTIDQVNDFVADGSDDAYEQVVGELLERPEYGQRWARHWLDVARYADTTGYQEGAERRFPFAWTYRDYVVRSLNEDTRFDHFVIEQLAADKVDLPVEQRWKLAAMGFLTLGPRFNYVRHEIIDDRIDAVTRGLLGLTVACARCHDHKYDPILAEDYYRLYGVFASSREPLYADLPRIGLNRGDFGRYREFRKKVAQATRSFEQFHARIHNKIRRETRAQVADYLRYLVQLMPAHRTVVQPTFETDRGAIRGPTPYGPGTIVRWQHFIESRTNVDPVFGIWKTATRMTRGDFWRQLQRVVERRQNMNGILRQAILHARPSSMLGLASVYGEQLENVHREWNEYKHQHPRVNAFPDAQREQLRQVLYGRDSPIVMNEDEAHDCYTSAEFDQFMPKKRRMDSLFVEYQDVVSPRAMVLVDRDVLHEPRIFQRGQATRPGPFVTRGFLRLFPELSESDAWLENSGRLALARAIVHPSNPLTPRVIVNRVWYWHFGRGLVDTPSDFGTRAPLPSHPDLLDWLAADFVDHGWSLKRLHKQIVMSSTWKQSSLASEQAVEIDPDNRFLSHMNRRRLEFEALRDAMLAIAGRLQRELGGPPDDEVHSPRRSVYLLVNRDDLNDVYVTFDFPSPDISLAKRSETTVPQQALFMMNSEFVSSMTDHLVRSLERELEDAGIHERIGWLYERILTRQPSHGELLETSKVFDFQRDDHAFRDLAQVLLMSNEFLFVD